MQKSRCQSNIPLKPRFNSRTHAHKLGSVITGYKVHDNNFEVITSILTYSMWSSCSNCHNLEQEIARGDPQKPQTFYPMRHFVHLSQDDQVAARCTYDTRGETEVTRIGGSWKKVE